MDRWQNGVLNIATKRSQNLFRLKACCLFVFLALAGQELWAQSVLLFDREQKKFEYLYLFSPEANEGDEYWSAKFVPQNLAKDKFPVIKEFWELRKIKSKKPRAKSHRDLYKRFYHQEYAIKSIELAQPVKKVSNQ